MRYFGGVLRRRSKEGLGGAAAHLLFLSCAMQLCGEAAPATGTFLPGSCVAAGFTGCCLSSEKQECAGVPPACFCDPSCYDFDDCCSDLLTICSPTPSPASLPSKPLFTLVTDITFHSANIYWMYVSPIGTTANVSFAVHYNSSLLPEQFVNFTDDAPVASAEFYSLTLKQLIPGSHYHYRVIAFNLFGSNESDALSFTTHQLPVIEGVELFMINSTAVEVFWQPVSLPMGVSILAHTVYFVALNQSFLEKRKVCETSVSFCEVAGLASHALYNFRVSYTLLDIDGLYSESTLSNASTIFLQASIHIHLGAEPFLTCHLWSEFTDEEVNTFFRYEIKQAITTHYNLHDVHISDELLLCMDSPRTASSSEDTSSAYVLYKASIWSSEELSPEQITMSIAEIVESGLLREVNISGILMSVILSNHCHIHLSIESTPLCSPENGSSYSSPSSMGDDTCVSIPILVSAIAAELLLLLTLGMGAVVVTLVIHKRRMQHKNEKEIVSLTPVQRPVDSNDYVMTSGLNDTATLNTLATNT